MDTRIGYPNEHLAGDSDEEFSSPLYYRSRVSDEWYRQSKHSAIKIDEIASKSSCISRLLPRLRTEGRKK
jgi:cell division protein FtsA